MWEETQNIPKTYLLSVKQISHRKNQSSNKFEVKYFAARRKEKSCQIICIVLHNSSITEYESHINHEVKLFETNFKLKIDKPSIQPKNSIQSARLCMWSKFYQVAHEFKLLTTSTQVPFIAILEDNINPRLGKGS